MAQVIHTPTTRQRIDASLAFSLNEWRSVPELADEWAEWEVVDRLTFRYEWSIREDHLDQLAQWRAWGLFTEEQRAQYAELLDLVARHRPILDALFADS